MYLIFKIIFILKHFKITDFIKEMKDQKTEEYIRFCYERLYQRR